MDNFYITLTSNSKSNFEDISKFRKKLSSNVNLKGDWDVGLTSISFPNSAFNFNEKEYINYTYYDSFNNKMKIFKKPVEISMNNYIDIKSLMEEIASSRIKSMNSLKKGDASIDLPELELNTKNNILFFQLKLYNNFLVFPQMSEHLCYMLGFDKKLLDQKISDVYQFYEKELTKNSTYIHKHANKDKTLSALFSYNLKCSLNSIFLHCDLIKETHFNEHSVQLLRCIEIPNSAAYGDQISINYPICHYIPVRYNEFESIEITLKDEIGDYFPFRFGNILITLHFRRQ